MKAVVKRPGERLSVIEVSGLEEINQIVGNVDENGKGYSFTGSDYRQEIFSGIDVHMNGNAIFNTELEQNFWDLSGNKLYCGNVIFVGYDPKSENPCGVCSLSDEQVEYIKNNIRRVYDI